MSCNNSGKVYLCQDENKDFQLDLTEIETKRLGKITNKQKKREFSYFRSRFNQLAKQESFGPIQYERSGKPVSPSHYISISNSNQLGGLALFNHPIGLDIQYHIPNVKLELLMQKFSQKFTDNLDFFEFWTKIEAIAKLESVSIFKAAKLSRFYAYEYYHKSFIIQNRTYSLGLVAKIKSNVQFINL